MSLSFGFYNSQNHDRMYNAVQMSQLFDGIIRDGVFYYVGDRFAVKAVPSSFSVTVGSGRAWFNGTWTYNDSDYTLELDQSEIQVDRWDAIVLEVNASPNVRRNYLKVIKGTPAQNPQKPEPINNKLVHQHVLAYIKIPGDSTKVIQSNIETQIGTTKLTPWVTGPLQVVDAKELTAQWDDRYKQQYDTHTESYSKLIREYRTKFSDSYDSWNRSADTRIREVTGRLDATERTMEADFQTWYDNIKGQLSEDAAGHLQNEIDDINTYKTVTVSPSGWSLDSATSCYKNTVYINGIKSTSNPVIDVVLTGDLAKRKNDEALWANVLNAVTANGSITLYAKKQLTGTFTMCVKGF